MVIELDVRIVPIIDAMSRQNIDQVTVSGFGQEWTKFDQSKVSEAELQKIFEGYFSLVDWTEIPENAIAMDVGCGSGRWAKFVAPKVGHLHLVDPSGAALAVAREKLSDFRNCTFHQVSTEFLPIEDNSCDLIYSLGVLHHVPDTQSAINDCVKKLKPGSTFLIYLYYRFDNRAIWFRIVWIFSDLLRNIVSRLPFLLKRWTSDFLAFFVYWPLSRLCKVLESRGRDVSSLPLSFYRNSSLYTMRTDALDRFGTRLEHRFTKREIEQMLTTSGLIDIRFRNSEPFWCAIGQRPSDSQVAT